MICHYWNSLPQFPFPHWNSLAATTHFSREANSPPVPSKPFHFQASSSCLGLSSWKPKTYSTGCRCLRPRPSWLGMKWLRQWTLWHLTALLWKQRYWCLKKVRMGGWNSRHYYSEYLYRFSAEVKTEPNTYVQMLYLRGPGSRVWDRGKELWREEEKINMTRLTAENKWDLLRAQRMPFRIVPERTEKCLTSNDRALLKQEILSTPHFLCTNMHAEWTQSSMPWWQQRSPRLTITPRSHYKKHEVCWNSPRAV